MNITIPLPIAEPMFDVLYKVGTSIIGLIIVFILGLLFTKIYQYIRTTLPAQKVWQLKDEDKIFIVTPNPSGYINEEYSDTVFPTDYMATAELRGFLTRVYKKIDISEYFAIEFPSEKLGENLILLGDQHINPATEMMNKRLLKLRIPLEFENDHITDIEDKNKPYYPDISFDPSSHRNEVIKDFAIILCINNPIETKKRLYILAGCYVYGNLAAVHAMIAPKIKQISKRLKGKKQFCCLIKCSVSRRGVGTIEICRFYIYETKQKKWVHVKYQDTWYSPWI